MTNKLNNAQTDNLKQQMKVLELQELETVGGGFAASECWSTPSVACSHDNDEWSTHSAACQ